MSSEPGSLLEDEPGVPLLLEPGFSPEEDVPGVPLR